MSRIGKKPIAVTGGTSVAVGAGTIKVKGPKGEMSQVFDTRTVDIKVNGSEVVVARMGETREHRAKQGLYRALVRNMVEGCTTGFKKELDINGVGYTAKVSGAKLTLQIGFCHPVEMTMPTGIKIEASSPTHLVISGADRQMVGQMAADIRAIRPPEPYNGKGIKYTLEVIRRKAGKTVASK